MLPRKRVIAFPDVIEPGLLEIAHPLDVVANVVAETLWRNTEAHPSQIDAPFPPHLLARCQALYDG